MRIGLLLKLFLILFGAFSAAILVRQSFGLPSGKLFFSVFELVNNSVGTLLLPLEIGILNPLRNYLETQGIVLMIESHWKYAFVLMWLYFAAFKRANAPTKCSMSSKSALVIIGWLIAGAIAFLFGVLTGLNSIGSAAAFWWPASGFFFAAAAARWWNTIANTASRNDVGNRFGMIGTVRLMLGIGCVVAASLSHEPLSTDSLHLFWFPFLLLHAEALFTPWARFAWRSIRKRAAQPPAFKLHASLGVIAYFLLFGQFFPSVNVFLGVLPSPGLASFFFVVILEAALQLVRGLQRRENRGSAKTSNELDDRPIRIGVQVLYVLGGAFSIALLDFLHS
jgi:hypothetical protein